MKEHPCNISKDQFTFRSAINEKLKPPPPLQLSPPLPPSVEGAILGHLIVMAVVVVLELIGY